MLKWLSSVRITVVCLFLLFVLTFWGTIAQVQQGLYSAQERYFNSLYFLAGGVFPFPGAQLVLWVLFINLLAASISRFIKYRKWSYAGILLIHFSLLLYFLAAFFVFHIAKESNIHLAEGQSTNVSSAYFDWEVAYWVESTSGKRDIVAKETSHFKPDFIVFSNNDFSLKVKQYYPNSEAFSQGGGKRNPKILNDTGISLLTPKNVVKEREQNTAGGIFTLQFKDKSYTLVLYGLESKPTSVDIDGKVYNFSLRLRRYPLPFTLKLDQFKAEFYPGTEMAKSYESLVTITTGTLQRQVRIYMNNPLRYKDYTIYQASYSKDAQGREYSTLAVVKNSARLLPYVACLLVFVGLALHFLIQAFSSRRKS